MAVTLHTGLGLDCLADESKELGVVIWPTTKIVRVTYRGLDLLFEGLGMRLENVVT